MSKTVYSINDFSQHLFWDVDRNKLDLQKNKQLIVERVIQRGSRSDLQIILSYYGKQEAGELLKQVPWLNEKDMAFVNVFFDIPFSEMKCYTKRLSARYCYGFCRNYFPVRNWMILCWWEVQHYPCGSAAGKVLTLIFLLQAIFRGICYPNFWEKIALI